MCTSLCVCMCIHTYVSVCLYVCADVLKCTCGYSCKMCVEARGQPQVSFSGTTPRSFETPSLISSQHNNWATVHTTPCPAVFTWIWGYSCLASLYHLRLPSPQLYCPQSQGARDFMLCILSCLRLSLYICVSLISGKADPQPDLHIRRPGWPQPDTAGRIEYSMLLFPLQFILMLWKLWFRKAEADNWKDCLKIHQLAIFLQTCGKCMSASSKINNASHEFIRLYEHLLDVHKSYVVLFCLMTLVDKS